MNKVGSALFLILKYVTSFKKQTDAGFVARFYKLLVILLLLTIACKPAEKEILTIAAASNMQFALEELAIEFTKETGLSYRVVTGASGMLTSQMAQGAPYHIFMSANMDYPNYLFKQGLTVEPPVAYAKGTLILWSTSGTALPELSQLKLKPNQLLAVANPETAPYGKAALEVLNHYNLFNEVQAQLVYGENIAQTNQFIASGAAYCGFTSKSVIMAPDLQHQGNWQEINRHAYTPIKQGMVILKNSVDIQKKARVFTAFLFSKKGRRILEKYGYLPLTKTPI